MLSSTPGKQLIFGAMFLLASVLGKSAFASGSFLPMPPPPKPKAIKCQGDAGGAPDCKKKSESNKGG